MTPQQIATATSAMINGATQTAAAQASGVHESTLRWALNRDPDLQDRIRNAQISIINSSLLKAITNQELKISAGNKEITKYHDGKELHDQAKTILELADRAESKLLESVGIYPSHTQSIQVLNLTQINMEISPEVSKLLAFEEAAEVVPEMGVDLGARDNDADK